ncbi:MAG TPA: hypothetical protein VFA08_08330 [Actinomycetota bacterium]|jgi:hypothetical protein|nr:hypothetical protein [Actinomycetota bacterium]
MDQPALQFVMETVVDAVNFDGDVTALASRAQEGDQGVISELTRAHAAVAVLTGICLRPSWLSQEDAAQEAILVLTGIVERGSERIAAELPGAIEARFDALEKRCGGH